MKNIDDKLKNVIDYELNNKTTLLQLQEFDKVISQLECLGISTRATYSFPQIDTIGKNASLSLNNYSI